MDLALALNYPTVDAMLRRMTARELGQWETYARRYFLPQQRIELALANMARMSAGSSDLASFVFDSRLRDLLTPKARASATADEAAGAMAQMFGGARIVHLNAVPMGQERRASNG